MDISLYSWLDLQPAITFGATIAERAHFCVCLNKDNVSSKREASHIEKSHRMKGSNCSATDQKAKERNPLEKCTGRTRRREKW